MLKLEPGDLLRLAKPLLPGAGKSCLPSLQVSIVAYEVLRVVGDVVHLFGFDTFTKRLPEVDAGILNGKWKHERPRIWRQRECEFRC